MRVRRLLFAFLVAACATHVGPAAADDDADLKRARSQFSQAIAMQTAGNWSGALKLLRDVATVKRTPQVQFNIALCEENLGQLVAAIGDYRLASADAEEAGLDDVAREAGQRADALATRVPSVTIELATGTDGATVELDGVSIGAARFGKPTPIDPGRHVVEASAGGSRPFKESFEVAEGESHTVTVVLEPEAKPDGPIQGPVSSARIEPGSSKTLPLVISGAGVVSLGASGVFFALRGGAISDLDDQCGAERDSCPASAKSTFDNGRTYNTIANVTLGVGIVAVGVGVGLFVAGGKQTDEAGSAIVPAAPGSVAGASWVSRF